MAAAENFVERYTNVPMAGFHSRSFILNNSANPPLFLNTRVYSCILLSNTLPPALGRWRGKFNEDTDLSLRLLKHGYVTVLFNAFLMAKQKTYGQCFKKGKGGNTAMYAKDNRREFAESLARQHPDVARVVKKYGRWHHQVNYGPFSRNALQAKRGVRVANRPNEYGMVLRPCTRGRVERETLKK